MNTPLLCMLALLAADPSSDTTRTIFRSQSPLSDVVAADDLEPLVIRAQGSPFFGGGGTPPTYAPPATIPPGGTTYPPQNYPISPPANGPYFGGAPQFGAPATGDPFLGGGVAPAPYGYNPYAPQQGTMYTFGLNGPQPFRYGWQARYDFGFMPSEGTSSPNVGSLSIFEADFEKELVTPWGYGHTFSIAPQFNFRSWDGPLGVAGGNAGLPGEAYRLGLGLKLASRAYGAWQFEGGFNPSVASDFSGGVSSDAILFDAHLAAFYRASPQFMIALGAAYWDRVDEIILPYAGVVWTPNDYWEFRLLFPKPRISRFIGTPFGIPSWLYATGEYHVDAFEVNVDPINRDTRVQFEDIRVLGGIRSEFGSMTTFLEAGYVFERKVDFDATFGTDFDINSGFLLRGGFRY